MRGCFASSCASTLALACAACGGIVGNGSGATDAGAGSRDASPSADVTVQESSAPDATDATPIDAACPAPGQVRAPGGACACPSTTYSALDDVSNWATFDVPPLTAEGVGLTAAAFDSRYLYMANNVHAVRYDTSASFTAAPSWAFAPELDSAAGVERAAFDGHYVYFVPDQNGSFLGVVARYDPQGAFGSTTSWSTFDVSTVNPGAVGFDGAVFDGRYLYLVPNENNSGLDGIVARYDTTATFDDPRSWATFDVSTVDNAAKGFRGGTFDGRYVYFVPGPGLFFQGSALNPNARLSRYDTTADFGSSASWATFDLKRVDPGVTQLAGSAFAGAAFDGRYVYLVPFDDGDVPYSVAIRYDTASTFADPASWSAFDVSTVNSGAKAFQGATFDGRYIYFAPSYNLYIQSPFGEYSVIVRYDTTTPFASSASWKAFDLATLNPGAKGFAGAVFDGRYVYLVPYFNGIGNGMGPGQDGLVVRLDAKDPACLPTGWNASFF